MKAQLWTLVMLLCVGMGHGLWLRTHQGDSRRPELMSQRPAPETSASKSSPSTSSALESSASESFTSKSSASESSISESSAPGSAGRSRRSPADSPCALSSVLVRVRDLGLGYDSDEEVLLKFCGGACPQLRSNHDLALRSLLQSGLLPEGGAALTRPCCRPTHHEDMAFLDNQHRWHRVEALSAAGCHCVG